MLTTIFTGHTLDLADIVAISAPMRQFENDTVILFVDLFLRNSEKIRHVHFYYQDFNIREYEDALEDLLTKNMRLIADWKALHAAPLKMITDDPAPKYKRIRKSKKGGTEG
jgi:hypothetical protein